MDNMTAISILANIILMIICVVSMWATREWNYRHQAVDTILKKYVDKCIETFGEKARMVLQEVLQAEVDKIKGGK